MGLNLVPFSSDPQFPAVRCTLAPDILKHPPEATCSRAGVPPASKQFAIADLRLGKRDACAPFKKPKRNRLLVGLDT